MPTKTLHQLHDSVMVAVALTLSPARPEHVNSIRTLEKIIRYYHGFQLILALYNDPPNYRNQLIEYLNGLVTQAESIDARDFADFAKFEHQLSAACAASELVHIVGLDAWLREKEGKQRLQGFNLHREALARDCIKPIVLWLPLHLATQFALQAPDVWEWRRAVLDFSVEGDELSDLVLNSLDRVTGLGEPVALPVIETFNTEIMEGDWGHARFTAEASKIENWKYSGQTTKVLDASIKLYRRAIAEGENAYPEAKLDTAIASLLLGQSFTEAGAADKGLPLLVEAQRRFEQLNATRLAAMALKDQGDSFRWLGQYDQATLAYMESIYRSEKLGDRVSVAVTNVQLGTVRLFQKKYEEALKIYQEALTTFLSMGDSHNAAGVWQLIGKVYSETGQYDNAVRAYNESLVITTRLYDVGEQAKCLGELGILYSQMNRLEDSVAYYRKSIGKLVEIRDTFREGMVRSNFSVSLVKLNRINEARNEILKAIKCIESYGHAAEPWNIWNNLRSVEALDGNTQAAEEARQKALELFLAYRRDGGENQNRSGRLCAAVAEALRIKNTDEAQRLLNEWRDNPAYMREGKPKPLLDALTEIINGKRDPSLADNPDLTYDQAAEIILFLETLRSAE